MSFYPLVVRSIKTFITFKNNSWLVLPRLKKFSPLFFAKEVLARCLLLFFLIPSCKVINSTFLSLYFSTEPLVCLCLCVWYNIMILFVFCGKALFSLPPPSSSSSSGIRPSRPSPSSPAPLPSPAGRPGELLLLRRPDAPEDLGVSKQLQLPVVQQVVEDRVRHWELQGKREFKFTNFMDLKQEKNNSCLISVI